MPTETDRIKLVVNGKEREEWSSYSIVSDLDNLADRFELSLNDYKARFSHKTLRGRPCQIYCNDKLIISGNIDEVKVQLTKQRRELTITGRDKIGKLVDCTSERHLFVGQTLDQIATAVGKKHEILVRVEGDGGKPFNNRMTIPGAAVWKFLTDLAAEQRLGLWMDPDGTLVVGRPRKGPVTAVLYHGVGENRNKSNIENITIQQSIAESYSSVEVLCQRKGNDKTKPEETCRIRAVVKDDDLIKDKIYRPLIIEDSNCENMDQAMERAKREMNRSKLAKLKVEATVAGHGFDGRIWTLGQIVTVHDEASGFHEDMMIMGRTLSRIRSLGRANQQKNKSGARTYLRLRLPGLWP